MTLTKKDLESIKDIVEFSITASERRMEGVIEEKITDAKEELKDYIDKQTDDLAEINREFLVHLDNHEKRIVKLEDTVLKTA